MPRGKGVKRHYASRKSYRTRAKVPKRARTGGPGINPFIQPTLANFSSRRRAEVFSMTSSLQVITLTTNKAQSDALNIIMDQFAVSSAAYAYQRFKIRKAVLLISPINMDGRVTQLTVAKDSSFNHDSENSVLNASGAVTKLYSKFDANGGANDDYLRHAIMWPGLGSRTTDPTTGVAGQYNTQSSTDWVDLPILPADIAHVKFAGWRWLLDSNSAFSAVPYLHYSIQLDCIGERRF